MRYAPDYFTVQEAADRLLVTPETVRRWIAAGRLPAVVLPGGREYRIYREDLALALIPASDRGEDQQ